ncbi:MAG: DnaJ domain-containing protein [Clostridia bacterium]|nr:DnaJ domain-containing protein [Clostridia bacterium]
MIFKDYYKILGLNSNKITENELKIAYREAAKKYHPDVNNKGNFSEERFKDINEAYKILSNPITKRRYDRTWVSNVGNKKKVQDEGDRKKGSIISDIVGMFFGNVNEKNIIEDITNRNKKEAVKGEDIETEIDVSIEDSFYGKEKMISLRTVNGKMKTFTVKVPEGIRNNEKIRLLRTR